MIEFKTGEPVKDGTYITEDKRGVLWANKFIVGTGWYCGMGGWRSEESMRTGGRDRGLENYSLEDAVGELRMDSRYDGPRVWAELPGSEPGLFD